MKYFLLILAILGAFAAILIHEAMRDQGLLGGFIAAAAIAAAMAFIHSLDERERREKSKKSQDSSDNP
jgi:hypothetical protein